MIEKHHIVIRNQLIITIIGLGFHSPEFVVMNRLESAVDKNYITAKTPKGNQFHDMHTECDAQELLHTF